MELLDRYIKEIEEDLKIDEFNIKELSLKVPAKKHFWVSRLITHKRNLIKLELDKSNFKKAVIQELHNQAPIKISQITAENTAESHDKIKEINLKIAEEKLIIEFLEKTEKTFSALGFDLKNVVEIMKLEQL